MLEPFKENIAGNVLKQYCCKWFNENIPGKVLKKPWWKLFKENIPGKVLNTLEIIWWLNYWNGFKNELLEPSELFLILKMGVPENRLYGIKSSSALVVNPPVVGRRMWVIWNDR